MSRIRILRLIARMNVGGPAQQIVGLQRGLDPDRFESRLITGSVEEGEEDHLHLRAPDLEVIRLPELGRSLKMAGDAKALAACIRAIRSFRPDIVHTHTAKAGVIGRVAAGLAGAPLRVHTFHGHLLHGYFSPRVTAAVTVVERILARQTTRLLAVGEQVRDDLLRAGIGDHERFDVVPPGVEVARPPRKDVARAELGLPAGVPVISFVARLTPIKQPLLAVDVVRQLVAARPDVRMVVAGQGPLLEAMRAAAEDLPVDFLGWRADVHRIYAASDVTLLTSANEGMPVSLIEAGLCGRPAVATDVGSVREVVVNGRTGRVVDPDASQLAAALLELLGDRTLLDEMGDRARVHCRDRFGMERLVRDTEALYTQLVRGDTR